MLVYVVRRVAMLCALAVFVSFVTFSLLYASPSNAVDILVGGTGSGDEETRRALLHEFHLDQPFLTQYWIWAKGALQFDFGNSLRSTLPVSNEIVARLPVSVFLAVYAFLITVLFGIALGVAAAFRRRTVIDRGIVAGALVGLSMPAFVSGVFLLFLLAVKAEWFPVFGQGTGFVDQLWHLTLPALALATHTTAVLVKHTRAAVMNVLDQDYVIFARARGLPVGRVLIRYILRNALIPIITVSAPLCAGLVVGAVLAEVLFSLPGIGTLFLESANGKDLPMVQALAILIALLIMGANLLADLAYTAVDPRIRLGNTGRQ